MKQQDMGASADADRAVAASPSSPAISPVPASIPSAVHREDLIFAMLCRKYVQRSDSRQREMGLQYTTAETRDLARFIDNLIEDFDESCKHGYADWHNCVVCALRERESAQATEARRTEASAWGPVNGLGENDRDGSYVLLGISAGDHVQRFRLSAGAAEVLAAELEGAVRRRSLRSRIQTTKGDLVDETDYQIACALRWYRRQGSRHALMARIDELEAQAMSAREGQDPQVLGAKPASAAAEGHAPEPGQRNIDNERN